MSIDNLVRTLRILLAEKLPPYVNIDGVCAAEGDPLTRIQVQFSHPSTEGEYRIELHVRKLESLPTLVSMLDQGIDAVLASDQWAEFIEAVNDNADDEEGDHDGPIIHPPT